MLVHSSYLRHFRLIAFLYACILLSSCTGYAATTTTPTIRQSSTVSHSITPSPSATRAATPHPTPTAAPPTRYVARVLLQGEVRPDDLAFDLQGRLLFSDSHNGLIGRLNNDGSTTILLRGLAEPEGIVVLRNGTIVIAEQGHHRILALAPGAAVPIVLRDLPGTPSTAHCKDGVDGIALDETNNTLIVPDSPTGEVYRMSLDGKSLTLLASGIVRPVGAAVDGQGTIYVADECGGALWKISPKGTIERVGGFGMLDDVALDTHGDVLVTDLDPAIHALIRMNLTTGKRTTLASAGYIEPQGLIVGTNDTIFMSDDYANVIVEYRPA